MTTLSDSLPGWAKRRRDAQEREGDSASDPQAETGAATASVTSGGSGQEPVVVWEAINLMEAQVVKARLESEGIPAFIRSEALGAIYGLTAGSLARADVLVPGPLAEKAIELLFDEQEESSEDEQP